MRFWIALAIVLLWHLGAMWLIPLCAEDAYITFHAALDPAWHRATTSALWALLCTPGSPNMWPPEVLARWWALVADVVAVYAASRLLTAWGLAAFVTLWCGPFFVGSVVSGLETHAVAALLLLSRVHPIGYAIAAALRPDAAVLSLVASGKRWRWALAGGVACVAIGFAYSGLVIPQTIASKAAVYGIHPGAWGWLHPQGFGWMTIALLPGAATALPAVAWLLWHVAAGTPAFWWYAVAPIAMLGLAACERVRGWRSLAVALVIVCVCWGGQVNVLHNRVIQERNLWNTGGQLADMKPTGTILLEPAGMIPYLNRQLTVVDDVGLTDPWMAERRQRIGWRTDAADHYKPRWIVMRLREYMFPSSWGVGQRAFYNLTDAKLPDYRVVAVTGVAPKPAGKVVMKMISSNLVILKRR